MSQPTHDHDTNPRRLGARVDASATVALGATGATGATVTSTELDSLTTEAGAWLASLSALVRVHGLVEHALDIADAPNTTWELPVSGLQDLQPTAASGGSHP